MSFLRIGDNMVNIDHILSVEKIPCTEYSYHKRYNWHVTLSNSHTITLSYDHNSWLFENLEEKRKNNKKGCQCQSSTMSFLRIGENMVNIDNILLVEKIPCTEYSYHKRYNWHVTLTNNCTITSPYDLDTWLFEDLEKKSNNGCQCQESGSDSN